jgi:hypothetical protein
VNAFRREEVRPSLLPSSDASRWNKHMFVPMAIKILDLVLEYVVVTTGSARARRCAWQDSWVEQYGSTAFRR